jgi:hypothetical protein
LASSVTSGMALFSMKGLAVGLLCPALREPLLVRRLEREHALGDGLLDGKDGKTEQLHG